MTVSRCRASARRSVWPPTGAIPVCGKAVAAFLLFLLVFGTVPAPAAQAVEDTRAGADKTYRLDIPAGTLAGGLAAFSRQTGLEVGYDHEIAEGLRTPGVRGEMTAGDGLKALLAETGLAAAVGGDGRWTLAEQRRPGAGETVLPTMEVQGEPVGTHEISMDKLRRTMAMDMADVFKDEPSIVVGGGARNAQRLYVRGVDSTNLNMTIDGAKQGGSLHQHRGDIGSIDPRLLKKVAVQTGSSADAGPGALGGSIRFETVDAQDMLGPDKSVGATIRGSYGSVDKSWGGGATAYGRFAENFGILANFSGRDRRDYTIGGGDTASNTAGEDYDYMLKLSMLDLADHSLKLSAEQTRDSGLYVWGGVGSDMGSSSTVDPVYVFTERTSLVADHRYNPKNQYVDSHINLYYNQNSVENRDGDADYYADVLGGDVRNTFHFTWGPVQNDMTAGFDYVGEEDRSEVSGSDTENDSHNAGLFMQNRLSWGPARLSLGARIDEFGAEFGEHSFNGSRLSPSVGAEYDIIQGLTLFGNYGQAVRASGIIPGSWMANIDSSTVFSVSSPETSERYEAGLRYGRQGLFTESDTLRLEWTYFDTRMRNLITAQGGRGGVVREIMNSDPLFTKGWEATASWGVDVYSTSLGYTHVTTRDEFDEPITATRRLAAATGDRLVWDNRFNFFETWTFGYTMTYVARLEDVPDGEDERPGYLLHAVQAGWTPEYVPGLTLSLAVDNLFDRKYSEQTSLADSDGDVRYEPGRDVRFGVEYSF